MAIRVFELFFLAVFGSMSTYLALLSILAIFVKRKTNFNAVRMRKFAVVIPAHNEQGTIEKTLKSILEVDYPRDRFNVVVVADNCTDCTARVAREFGTIVYERNDSILRGKGRALRWGFDQLVNPEKEYDAFVVVDADSVVSKNFLSVMNFYLARGASVIQASDLPEPQPAAWSSEVVRLGMTLYNFVRPMGRRVLGCSAGLRGNGMCFSADLLREIPWQAYSLTEDLEYGLILLINGTSVVFAPEATVYASMPTNIKNAATQRARWETGRFSVMRKYARTLLMNAVRRRSLKFFDAFIELLIPAFVNVFAFAMVMLGINVILLVLGFMAFESFAWSWLIVMGLGALHVIIGLIAARADRLLFKALLLLPQYAIWKLTLYAKLMVNGSNKEWVRTTRENSIHQSGLAV